MNNARSLHKSNTNRATTAWINNDAWSWVWMGRERMGTNTYTLRADAPTELWPQRPATNELDVYILCICSLHSLFAGVVNILTHCMNRMYWYNLKRRECVRKASMAPPCACRPTHNGVERLSEEYWHHRHCCCHMHLPSNARRTPTNRPREADVWTMDGVRVYGIFFFCSLYASNDEW